MALSRRTGQRFQSSIWPGFVDAMTGLLMVLMFVLTIFSVVQFVLRDTISGQEKELTELSAEIASLAGALGLEQDRTAGLAGQVGQLTTALSDAADRADEQAQALQQAESKITGFEAQVAGLLADRAQARSKIADLTTTLGTAEAALADTRDTLANTRETLAATRETLDAAQAKAISDEEAFNLALAQARSEIDAETEAARLAAARAEALEALVADLRTTNADQQAQLEAKDAARLADAAAAQALRDRLSDADAELTAMTLQLEQKRKEAEETLTLLAAARAAEGDLNAQLAAALLQAQQTQDALASEQTARSTLTEQLREAQAEAGSAEALRAQLVAALAAQQQSQTDQAAAQSEADRQVALLAIAQDRLTQEQALSARAQRQVEALNLQVADLRREVGALQELLGLSEQAEREAKVQITSLGEQLNTALARVASEERARAKLEEAERLRLEEERDRLAAEAADLESYKSDFFGELSKIVAGIPGVRVEGDRFVFSSEVLFTRGKAELSDDGKIQIARVAETLRGIARDIPEGIDWIIRVDGHTDNEPLSGFGEFRDNWELSQARALSVVRFMSTDLGIAPSRLSANGFGEFRPIVPGNSAAARAQNRRIELKLTER